MTLLFALDQGCEEAVLLGAVGWRLDHTLYNTGLLERYAGRLRLAIAGQQADGAAGLRVGDDAAEQPADEAAHAVRRHHGQREPDAQ